MLAGAFLPEFAAVAEKVKGVGSDIEAQDVSHHGLYLLNAWIAEFKDMLAVLTNQMIVLTVSIRSFEQCQVLAELVPGNELAVEQ